MLVWREKIVNHRIGEWMGPYLVDSVELHKKFIHVRNEKREGYTLQLLPGQEACGARYLITHIHDGVELTSRTNFILMLLSPK